MPATSLNGKGTYQMKMESDLLFSGGRGNGYKSAGELIHEEN